MDNFKEAYDELVHKHLALKEQYEEIEENKYTGGDLATMFIFGMIACAVLIVIIGALTS